MFLGLDLSLASTGVAISLDSEHTETYAIAIRRTVGIARIQSIVARIRELTGGLDHPFTLCAIENYGLGGGKGGNNFHLAELGGVVRDHLTRWNLPFICVPPQWVKQWVGVPGNADKILVCQAIKNVYGIDFLRDDWANVNRGAPRPDNWGAKHEHWRNDEADAFLLAQIAAAYAGEWDRPLSPDQRGILEGIKADPEGVLTVAGRERLADKRRKEEERARDRAEKRGRKK